jgi:hypothetical protein
MGMTKIEATKEFVELIERSAREWKLLKSQLEKKYHLYDTYAEDYFGLRVDFSMYRLQDGDVITIQGAEIIDEEKYINFLLKYGDMPSE